MSFTVKSLLEKYEEKRPYVRAEKLVFSGVGQRDVYNITAPFEDEGDFVIAGRVEARNTEHSDVVFFTEKDGVWQPREDTQTYSLQDPFVSRIHGQLIFGGVEIFPDPAKKGALSWRTAFYRGENVRGLTRFAIGPDGMKDIRLIELANGRIGIFTRPQGGKGGRGKIGYTEIDSLDQMHPKVMESAPLVEAHFIDEEWGGVNEVQLLRNGKIAALGHIARFDREQNRHYYPITFLFNPERNRIVDMKIIATRKDFPKGPSKRADLEDVLFSGGLRRLGDGQAELYVGVSDAEAHKAIIRDPFADDERG